MITMTACVRPGCSGGPIIGINGNVIGLCTSNLIHNSGTSLPHCSFGIAAAALWEVWEWAKLDGIKQDTLSAIDVHSNAIDRCGVLYFQAVVD